MKALSLWQPWASAVATGAKRIETRSWSTAHRGPLAIHAAQHRHSRKDAHWLLRAPFWHGALSSYVQPLDFDAIPYGAIVAVCNLIDCVRTEDVQDLDRERLPDLPPPRKFAWAWTERQMGDFSPGRFAWLLEDVRMLEQPVPFRAFQRLFNVPDDLGHSIAMIPFRSGRSRPAP